MATPYFLTYPPRQLDGTTDTQSRDVLIFFISGNPGLIDYYEPFMSTLRNHIDEESSLQHVRFQIYGQDLAGFRDDDHEPFNSKRKPHDLEYQIQHTLKGLERQRIESGPRSGSPYDEILLIGHSVGSYIALELFQRHHRNPDSASHLNLTSGIHLFPTINNISNSSNGWKMDMLRRTPLLGDNAYRFAQGFLRLCPQPALKWIVHNVAGIPAQNGDITVQWLKSRDGVWQALHMGMDEMKVIGEDQWDDELWEIAHDAEAQHKPIPKFVFFFGKDDEWVAKRHRDEFIQKRQKQVERTKVVIDDGDIPHAFCIHHSETVAEKVSKWIGEMYSKR
ncbi:hypothetical protein F4821DRAFT_248138 [Hypoxylon rubiginosum]|uniref:Uncharacterized protein n=1 Tax=Hypoxylon rubiginosum TaxID=110542 RepID=A0ACC0CNW2_9PEZI|nr:hypothetical protein F4821DRAFT_248138 [Hypoxylon rubiginosum]